ncbi:MAG: hypothetical protein ACOC44_18055 [Promethearchaeia archaeon]
MKEVSYHIDGGISGYMGKKPKQTFLYLGILFVFLAIITFISNSSLLTSLYVISYSPYILAIVLLIIFSVLGVVCLYLWYNNKEDRSVIKIFILEEGTYYIEWDVFGVSAEKKVEKMPKEVNAELFLTIGILPDINFPTKKGKNLFSNILEEVREVLHATNCTILKQSSTTEVN